MVSYSGPRAWWCAVAIACALSSVAAAPSHGDEVAAKDAFDRGREHYLRGEFAEALPHLRRAYTLSGRRPSTIRALAQCEKALGSDDDALALLREYLATSPAKEDRESAEKMVAELEQKQRLRGRAPEERSEGDALWDAPSARTTDFDPPLPENDLTVSAPIEDEDRSILASPWFWIVSGAVIVLAGGTAIALGTAGSRDPPEHYGGSTGIVLEVP